MQRQLIHRLSYVLLLGVALATAACFAEPDFSNAPAISDPAITTYRNLPGDGRFLARRDSVVLSIRFRDGDGDLGESTTDSARQSQVFGNQSWGNYQITTLRLVNGRFQELPLSENNKIFFMPLSSQRGAIEGTLEYRQVFNYTNPFRNFTVKFRIKIRDRALNESNEIETDTVTVPFLAN